MFCPKCGKEITGQESYCPNCGNPINENNLNSTYQSPAMNFTPVSTFSRKSKTSAALLAFFLGNFGAHNFYLGHTTKAVTQLILTLTFIGAIPVAIWAFIEFIMILTGDIKDSGGQALTN